MKKIFAGILFCMLLIPSVLTSATIVQNTEIKNFIYSNGEVTITISIDDYQIENTAEGKIFSIENFGRLLIPGMPTVPSKIFAIAIPPGSVFNGITYEIKESRELSGTYQIPPVNLPRVIGEENPDIYQSELNKYLENYNAAYGSNNAYPLDNVEFVQTAGYRKYNLVDVRVNPITYYPATQKVIFNSEIQIHVSYAYPEGFDSGQIIIDYHEKTEKIANTIVYNYGEAQDWYPENPQGRNTYDYVIITLDSLVNKITDLVDWQEAKGRSVYVATTSWISSTYTGIDLAEKMRNFLRDKYPTSEWGILDACIIGHRDDVPMRRCWQDTGYGKPETDFYYAELSLPDSQSWDANGNQRYGENSDPIDMYAEINVGRIPWSDGTIVQDICQKSIQYETNHDASFKKNILLLGAYFWPDTDNAVLMEYKTNPSIHPWMASWTKTRMYEDAQSSYPCDYDLSYANVQSVWSQGKYAFVNWAGHGSPTACYEYYPSQAFVDTVTCNSLNDNYPAIIFADACSNSDTDHTNIGQMMLKQGAVGFLGATKVAYGKPGWTNPTSGSSQSFDYFFTTYCTSGDYTQGQAHQLSLVQMYQNNYWYYLKYETFQWGALWGNPDLTMAPVTTSDPPYKPTINGPDQGTYNETLTFTAVTTDPNGDDIYYSFDWGNGETSDWIGPYPSGVTATATNSWPGIGSYLIKVRARDSNSALSEWSDFHRVDITVNTCPEAPSINGPKIGKKGQTYQYTISANDPDNHDVSYFIFWGDDESTGWSDYYNSGEEVVFTHEFKKSGSITIKVRARDVLEYTSDWTNFEVVMPRTRLLENTFILKLFEKFTHVFQMFQRILSDIN
jgi:hypothetical protein